MKAFRIFNSYFPLLFSFQANQILNTLSLTTMLLHPLHCPFSYRRRRVLFLVSLPHVLPFVFLFQLNPSRVFFVHVPRMMLHPCAVSVRKA